MTPTVVGLRMDTGGARESCRALHVAARIIAMCLYVVIALGSCHSGEPNHATGSTPAPGGTQLQMQDIRKLGFAILRDVNATPLRGSVFSVSDYPDTRTIIIDIALHATDLATIQWNAYQAQRVVWTSAHYKIPAGWTLSVRQNRYDINYYATLVGSADESETHGYMLDWMQLSAEQAWAKYDATTYHGG